MPKKNYYDLLGVDLNASKEEIRKSYLMRSRVLHPDRFDPKTQSEEWKKANEMLAELNEAYSTLRDPHRRSQYDASMGFTQANSETNNNQANTKTKANSQTKNTNTTKTTDSTSQLRLKVTHLSFSDLPLSSQQRLLARQNGSEAEQFKIKKSDYVIPLILAILAITWLGTLMYLTNDNKWPSSDLSTYISFTIASSVVFWWAINKLYMWRTSQLKPHIYLTPLYFIKTQFDEIWFWWLWSVKDYKIVHQYTNGVYSYTTFSFIFEDGTQSFNLKSQNSVDALLRMLSQWQTQCTRAIAQQDMDYFLSRDDFLEVRTSMPTQPNSSKISSYKRKLKKFLVGYACAIIAGSILMILAYNLNQYFDDKKSWESARLFDKASAYRKYLESHADGLWKAEANSRIATLYEASAKQYLDSRNSKFDTQASNAVIELLNYAKTSQNYAISIAFLRSNQIPNNIETQLKQKFGVSNILSIGNSFSEYIMQSRESRILEAVKTAFKEVIAEDILEFKASQFKENDSAFLVTYTVRAGDSLYYHDRDNYIPEYSRPFYPGIFIDWKFEIRLPSKGSSYEFTLKSKPASQFSSYDNNVYDAMAQSAFDNFRSELVRRLGLHTGSEASNSLAHSDQATSPVTQGNRIIGKSRS